MAGRGILVVEDDRRLGTVLVRALERHGYAVRLAGSLAEARAALAVTTPDVILLDVDLPDGTGWELLDGTTGSDRASIVIVMSAGQPARRRLAQYQPYCFLSKPFAIDTLLELIEHADSIEATAVNE
jgi:DNA-binding NtrC family response regulator